MTGRYYASTIIVLLVNSGFSATAFTVSPKRSSVAPVLVLVRAPTFATTSQSLLYVNAPLPTTHHSACTSFPPLRDPSTHSLTSYALCRGARTSLAVVAEFSDVAWWLIPHPADRVLPPRQRRVFARQMYEVVV